MSLRTLLLLIDNKALVTPPSNKNVLLPPPPPATFSKPYLKQFFLLIELKSERKITDFRYFNTNFNFYVQFST